MLLLSCCFVVLVAVVLLCCIVTVVVVVIVGSGILSFIDAALGFGDPQYGGAGVLSAIFVLATIVPGIAVGVRRLHDINLSGWWYLLMLVPVVGVVLALVLLFKGGNEGDNEGGGCRLVRRRFNIEREATGHKKIIN